MAEKVSSTSSGSLNKPAKGRRKERQRWPFIKPRIYPSGAKSWIVDARTKSGGERKTFETVVEAETYADQCRVRRTNEGTAAFGNADLARYGKTVQDAIAYYLEHLRQQERSVPVKTAIEELIESRRTGGKSTEYCYGMELRLGRFGKAFGTRTVASVTAKELDAWLVGLAAAPSTRNTFRRDIQTLFSFCMKRAYTSTNPAAGTEMAKDVDKPTEILTVDEAAKVLKCCQPKVLAYTAIGMFAGLRSAEVEKLDWNEVDLATSLIEVKAHKAKTARRRLVRIEPVLKAWLEPIAKTSGPLAPTNLRRRLEASRRAAGFDTPGTETEKERAAGVKLKNWPSNALRHSFGSYWLAMHQDVAACALQMGNSPTMIFNHYREVVKPSEAKRYWLLTPAEAANIIKLPRAS